MKKSFLIIGFCSSLVMVAAEKVSEFNILVTTPDLTRTKLLTACIPLLYGNRTILLPDCNTLNDVRDYAVNVAYILIIARPTMSMCKKILKCLGWQIKL